MLPFTKEKQNQLKQTLLAALSLDTSFKYDGSAITLELVYKGNGRRLQASCQDGFLSSRLQTEASPCCGLPYSHTSAGHLGRSEGRFEARWQSNDVNLASGSWQNIKNVPSSCGRCFELVEER